jgi:hypothetical protein
VELPALRVMLVQPGEESDRLILLQVQSLYQAYLLPLFDPLKRTRPLGWARRLRQSSQRQDEKKNK